MSPGVTYDATPDVADETENLYVSSNSADDVKDEEESSSGGVAETNMSTALSDLTQRADALLADLAAFKDYLKTVKQESSVEMAHFRGTVQSELTMLGRLAVQPDSEAARHVARSSNLPFLETVWNTAKASKDLVALQKRIYFDPAATKGYDANSGQATINGRPKRSRHNSTIVDVIANGGRSWTKVSLVTNNRIVFDLAKQGWCSGGSDSEDEDSNRPDQDDDHDIPLVKIARELATAAKTLRVRTQHPTVTLILPRLEPKGRPEIEAIVKECRSLGVSIVHGKDVPTHQPINDVVEIEDNENLLPSLLYPAMRNRRLVSTTEAVDRMREIVSTIGTPSEKARSAILLGEDPSKSSQQLIDEMQQWSAYEVPSTWLLPIKVVDADENAIAAGLPEVANQVLRGQTSINRSVFLYGWSHSITTITSNRTVVKEIETRLNKYEDLDDATWPRIWLCPTARSLVGKEKRGAKKDGDKGAWPLPDSLRREQQRRHGLDVLSVREGHEVADLRPNGYDYADVIAAKLESER
ncbi:hypothetical protein B0A48_01053 [Cryoendolithus antarcticus]|uniref:DUF1308 domain-containing protein n=1 Tax=Cryoendolithus antarcticus TaxID=1507870 RepID=A0A1V8TS60_9PEZI|nr:hypothetical protein B0A48_01053 [Cryoendolithus antarcticus]